jgi:hypothetical protein
MMLTDDEARALFHAVGDDLPRHGGLSDDALVRKARQDHLRRRTTQVVLAAAAVAAIVLGAASLPPFGASPAGPSGEVATTAGAPSPTTPPTTPTDSPAATDQPKTAAACEGPMSAPVALVEVNPDTSKPRCLIVRPDQRLRVLNTTSRFGQRGTSVVVTFARWSPQTLDPGESITFNAPVGQVLDLGVHDLRLEVGGQHWATEVWVKEALDATADPSPRAIRVVVPSHCGVLSVRVHDVLWLADPPLGDHNPPPGWDENETPGYLTRTGPQTATFLADSGQTALFRRAPADAPDPAAGCD